MERSTSSCHEASPSHFWCSMYCMSTSSSSPTRPSSRTHGRPPKARNRCNQRRRSCCLSRAQWCGSPVPPFSLRTSPRPSPAPSRAQRHSSGSPTPLSASSSFRSSVTLPNTRQRSQWHGKARWIWRLGWRLVPRHKSLSLSFRSWLFWAGSLTNRWTSTSVSMRRSSLFCQRSSSRTSLAMARRIGWRGPCSFSRTSSFASLSSSTITTQRAHRPPIL
mmetsp:Transcript_26006/g.79072  ORF Transcript_26006/g.79072 Transcript_26006/m.79072 type:complete len:219 (-) Transcript_26006:951-1607(-)